MTKATDIDLSWMRPFCNADKSADLERVEEPKHYAMSSALDAQLLRDKLYSAKREGLLFTNTDPIRDPKVEPPSAHICKCDMFVLKNAEDRERYGDLRAVLQQPGNELMWEERVKDAEGNITVYITYTMYRYLDDQILKKMVETKE